MIENFKEGEDAVPEARLKASVVDRLLLAMAVRATLILSADKRPGLPNGVDTYDRRHGRRVHPLKPQRQGHTKKGCFLRP